MIKIRLARGGSIKDPFYQVVVIDERRKRNGKTLDILGVWYPKKDMKNIDKVKLEKWLNLGAQKTQAVKIITER